MSLSTRRSKNDDIPTIPPFGFGIEGLFVKQINFCCLDVIIFVVFVFVSIF